jgi:energy-coupling factor transport system substrate-specific component
MKKQQNNKMAFFLIPLGIAVNFIGGQIIVLLKLPLYLDAIGTMVVAALCGPLYGVAVAVVTALLISITSPTALAYIGNYIIVGLFSGIFAYKNFFKKSIKSVIAGLAIGLFCGVAGSLVTVALFGGYSASATGVITGFLSATFGLTIPVANLISEVFSDIIDKIPSAIITYLIVAKIPNKFLLKLPYGNKYLKEQKTDSLSID